MKTTSYTINRHDVVDEVIDGEAILINLKSGSYYSLEGTACAIWERLLLGPLCEGALPMFMGQHFEGADPARTVEVKKFLEEMVTNGLLHASDSNAEIVNDTTTKNRVAYASPVLSKYTDMEALLLIDPIHDVTPTGWPAYRGENS